MQRSSVLLIMMIMMPSLVFADTAVLAVSQGQIAIYNITMNKTSSDIGINTFALLNNNNNNISIESSYQNCTATNIISCNVAFIVQQGSWGKLAVFDNGNLYENITLQNPINYTSPMAYPEKTYISVGISYLPYIIAIIFSSLIIGNVVYYLKKRENE